MLDIIHRVKNIELQNDIIVNSKSIIKFPRFEKKLDTTSKRLSEHVSHRFESLDQETIISIIEKARWSVISELESLGIDTIELDFYCQVQPVFEEEISVIDNDIDSELDSDFEDMDTSSDRRGYRSDHESEPDEEIQEDLNLLSGNFSY